MPRQRSSSDSSDDHSTSRSSKSRHRRDRSPNRSRKAGLTYGASKHSRRSKSPGNRERSRKSNSRRRSSRSGSREKRKSVSDKIKSQKEKMRQQLNDAKKVTTAASNLGRNDDSPIIHREEVDRIEMDDFRQDSFLSSRGGKKPLTSKDSDRVTEPTDKHMAAMFGGAGERIPTITPKATPKANFIPEKAILKGSEENDGFYFANASFDEDPTIRWKRWQSKLISLKQQLESGIKTDLSL